MMHWEQFRNIGIDDVLSMVGLARTSRATGSEAFWLGLGIGLASGAVATLILTPYSGSQAREKIARASEDLGRTVSNKVTELKSNLKAEGRGAFTPPPRQSEAPSETRVL